MRLLHHMRFWRGYYCLWAGKGTMMILIYSSIIKRSTIHLISLPRDFGKFKSIHMYDIVVKNRNEFEVRDV
ncbi:flowering-promoting factor 1-like protein 3 [Phtheirospermum japonicum]|uniref:Flowering-promoting factor 1-like protein 3 n=1 Tax=Phtheirospermum japonicum TaxID=374723 RepID=A0A830B707_9LAMI|nr:flowering-promoting factor 1-like protein 3 [Phtheirospermum japonicum]